MTQEKLAAMASVSIRTVQRAEEGRKMSAEVWKDFEAVLGSGPMLAKRAVRDGDDMNFFKTYKPLKRLKTAKDLLDTMFVTSASSLDYDVEPTRDILPVLQRAIQFLEKRLPRPWDIERRGYKPTSLSERLEDEAELNSLIDDLHGIGVSIFYESYWEDVLYPREDDWGGLYLPDDLKPEGRVLLQVMVSAADKDRESFPEVWDWGIKVVEREDDDVPF